MDGGHATYQKDFDGWNQNKKRLDGLNHRSPFVNVGEVWWASIGENVGHEMCGKSDAFTRPVVIYKKLTTGSFLVIPTTTKERVGTWYVTFAQNKIVMAACLHQIRIIDHRRLYSKIGELDHSDFKRVKKGFNDLYV